MKQKLLLLGLLALATLSACDVWSARTEGSSVIVSKSATGAAVSVPEPVTFDCDATFFGDSITADGNFDALFPKARVVNLGVYADTLEDLRRRIPQVQEANPACIFLLGGINSLRDDNLESSAETYRTLLQELRTACPQAQIAVQSVLPVGSDIEGSLACSNETILAFNHRLESMAEEFSMPYVDLWTVYEKDGALNPELTRDGVHLNFDVYGPWAELVRPYVEAPISAD